MQHEPYPWWLEWIVCWKVNGEKEDTTLVRTVWLQKKQTTFIEYYYYYSTCIYNARTFIII